MFLQLQLTISLATTGTSQFIASGMCFPSLLVVTSLLRITFAALLKPCHENVGKFQGSSESKFGGSEKEC